MEKDNKKIAIATGLAVVSAAVGGVAIDSNFQEKIDGQAVSKKEYVQVKESLYNKVNNDEALTWQEYKQLVEILNQENSKHKPLAKDKATYKKLNTTAKDLIQKTK